MATAVTDSLMSVLISPAATAERWARLRTSAATTANPRPCSPARAASTAALSASRLVWKAISSITVMISAMRLDAPLIARIAATASPTTRPPRSAASRDAAASSAAWRALSVFCLTVAVICSSDAAVSSSETACCWVPVAT